MLRNIRYVLILLICLRLFIPQQLLAKISIGDIIKQIEVASSRKKCIDLTVSASQPAFVRLEVKDSHDRIVHLENVFVSGEVHLQMQLKKLNTGNYTLNARSGDQLMATSFYLK